jgi:hypothetical protein
MDRRQSSARLRSFRGSISTILVLLVGLSTLDQVYGQTGRYIPIQPSREILDLKLGQQRANSNISENQVSRQAEISRLEGRIQAIEDRMGQTSLPGSTASGLAILNVLDAVAASQTEATTWESSRDELLRLVAEDYLLGLEVETARARIDQFKVTDSLRALERMRAKGLASEPQLDLKQLEYQQTRLRLERLEKLLAGYRKLLPAALGERATKEASANDD